MCCYSVCSLKGTFVKLNFGKIGIILFIKCIMIGHDIQILFFNLGFYFLHDLRIDFNCLV